MALVEAAWYGRESELRSLLARVAPEELSHMLSEKDKEGDTALSLAAQDGYESCVRALLACAGCSEGTSRMLADSKNHDGQTALHLAAAEGHESCLRALLGHSSRAQETSRMLAAKTSKGNSALTLAAYYGHENSASALLGYASNPKEISRMLAEKDELHETALHNAAFLGHESCLLVLLRHAGDPKETSCMLAAKNNNGDTALTLAARKGHESCVRALLDNAGNPKDVSRMLATKPKKGNTALHLAAWKGHESCVQVLLEHVGSAEEACRMLAARNDRGNTPVMVARVTQKHAVVKILKQAEKQKGCDHRAARRMGGFLLLHCFSASSVEEPAGTRAAGGDVTERSKNRWGTDMELVREGHHTFYPADYTPPHPAEDCLRFVKFVQFEGHAEVLRRAMDKADEVEEGRSTGVEVGTSRGHTIVIHSYTQESPVYISLKRCMRTLRNKDLQMWRCYIYHLENAILREPCIQGVVYRGTPEVFERSTYVPGKVVTWQAFSSATANFMQVFCHLELIGLRHLSGTLLLINSMSARDVSSLSAFPNEEEAIFPPNSKFLVTNEVYDAAGKKGLVPQIREYNVSNLQILILTEL